MHEGHADETSAYKTLPSVTSYDPLPTAMSLFCPHPTLNTHLMPSRKGGYMPPLLPVADYSPLPPREGGVRARQSACGSRRPYADLKTAIVGLASKPAQLPVTGSDSFSWGC
jgi:hypothetical protein